MKRFGLIGFPLTHSFSKKYFSEKFKEEGIHNCSYELFELNTIDELPQLLSSQPNLFGLNVTIPYKEAVLPYLHSLDTSAKKVGAVNVIKIEDGKLRGYNSDFYGFATSLQSLSANSKITNAVVLGTGGASKAVIAVLKDLGANINMISRSAGNNVTTYAELESMGIIRQADLIVNTTPLGMFPNTDTFPYIPYDQISKDCLAFDLVYNPEITKFLHLASQHGARIKNGYEMLELQAEKSWEIWSA